MPDFLLAALTALLLLFSAFFYGSITILPLTIIEAGVASVFLVWLAGELDKKKIRFVFPVFLFPLCLLLLLAVFQAIPLPLGLLKFLSGQAYKLYRQLLFGRIKLSTASLSINAYETVNEIIKIATYMGITLLLVNSVKQKKQISAIINLIILIGLFLSIYALIQLCLFPNRAYWFEPGIFYIRAFGPFIYRNSFACYINMIIPLALVYYSSDIPFWRRIFYGLSAWVMSMALFFTSSRGGIAVFAFDLAFLIIFSLFNDILKRRLKFIFFWLAAFILPFSLIAGTKNIFSRLLKFSHPHSFSFAGHGYRWADVLSIWRDFPLFGTGLGTFANISMAYRGEPTNSLFAYAHSDILQFFSETGILGFSFAVLFIIFYFWEIFRVFPGEDKNSIFYAGTGLICSLTGTLFYSFFDFNLHIPAVAILFFVNLGLTYRIAYLSTGKSNPA